LIYTFYSGRLAVAAGSNQKHFHLLFHRLLSPFHFEDRTASFLSSLPFLSLMFYYPALLLAAYSKQRGQALPSSSHNVNFKSFEAATAYGFDTRQDTSMQGFPSLTLFDRGGEASSLLNLLAPEFDI
jgi:hypothetical protein